MPADLVGHQSHQQHDPDMEEPAIVINNYLSQVSPIFSSLEAVMKIGEGHPIADRHFEQQRRNADEANTQSQHYFYKLMQDIGSELQHATEALKFDKENVWILDTCAAPGGFAKRLLNLNPTARVCAMTLPKQLGGHHLQVPHGYKGCRLEVEFVDITKLGLQFGLASHELEAGMVADQPFQGKVFDLAVCDGHLLRTNKSHRDETHEDNAAVNLFLSQLIFALSKLNDHGTMVILLHKAHAWSTIRTLYQFSTFSNIQLFKPRRGHMSRGSFYLVAKNVRPHSEAAQSTLDYWKACWRSTAINVHGPGQKDFKPLYVYRQALEDFLAHFGGTFVRMAEPVWQTQKEGIERTKWYRQILAQQERNKILGVAGHH